MTGLAAVLLLSGCSFFEADEPEAGQAPAPSHGLLQSLSGSGSQATPAPTAPVASPAPAAPVRVAQAPVTPDAAPPPVAAQVSAPPVQAPPASITRAPITQAPTADTIMPGAVGQADRAPKTGGLPLDGHINPRPDPVDAQKLVEQADAQMAGKDGKSATPENMASALALFEQAMGRGSLKAREALALYYYYGRGTAKDPQRAAEVVKPAAEGGLGMAALIYGQLYNSGGIPGAPDEAQYWYNIARRAGCAPCVTTHQEFLNSIEAKLKLPASKGQGDLLSDAIVLSGISDDADGVKREYTTLGILYPGWKRVEQRLLQENGRKYDQMTLENGRQHRVRVYFDITDWYGAGHKAGS
ncbi:MAG: tetratricopeptide repeat protein [Azospirillaceae bacterium]|nr:tetratricopeptide repeat protein [Azospirillaceae bacterium]